MGMFPRQEESHLATFFHTLIRAKHIQGRRIVILSVFSNILPCQKPKEKICEKCNRMMCRYTTIKLTLI